MATKSRGDVAFVAFGITLGVLAMGGLIWLIAWAIGQENRPDGRPWQPTGVAGLEQACTDSGHLVFRTGTRTLVVAPALKACTPGAST
jgi:hypothetical protein